MQHNQYLSNSNKLPIDVLLQIYIYLSPENLAILTLTNKFTNELLDNNAFWKNKALTHFPHYKNDSDTIIWRQKFREYYIRDYQNIMKGAYIESKYMFSFPTYREKDYQILFSLVKERKLTELQSHNVTYDELSISDTTNRTLLDWALECENQPILNYFFNIIEQHFDFDTNNPNSATLPWAVICNQQEIIDELLRSNVKLNDADIGKAIRNACRTGQLKYAQLLVGKFPQLVDQADNRGTTALFHAVRYPHIVKWLLENGANINLTSHTGSKAIHLASSVGNIEAVGLMLDKEPDLIDSQNNHNETPIVFAASKNQSEMVLFLARNGANLNISSDNYIDYSELNGYTALHWASHRNYPEVVKALIDCGADPFMITVIHRETPDKVFPFKIADIWNKESQLVPYLIRLEQYIRTNSTLEEHNAFTSFFASIYKKNVDSFACLEAATVLRAVVLGHADEADLEPYLKTLQSRELKDYYSVLKNFFPEQKNKNNMGPNHTK